MPLLCFMLCLSSIPILPKRQGFKVGRLVVMLCYGWSLQQWQASCTVSSVLGAPETRMGAGMSVSLLQEVGLTQQAVRTSCKGHHSSTPKMAHRQGNPNDTPSLPNQGRPQSSSQHLPKQRPPEKRNMALKTSPSHSSAPQPPMEKSEEKSEPT